MREARFTSDMFTTLILVHDHIMKEASNMKLQLNAQLSASAPVLRQSLSVLWPHLSWQRALRHMAEVLEALQELQMQDGEVDYLSPEYRELLANAEEIRKEFKDQPQHTGQIVGIIKDMYCNFCKHMGLGHPKAKLPALEQLLMDTTSTAEKALEFMLGAAGAAAAGAGMGSTGLSTYSAAAPTSSASMAGGMASAKPPLPPSGFPGSNAPGLPDLMSKFMGMPGFGSNLTGGLAKGSGGGGGGGAGKVSSSGFEGDNLGGLSLGPGILL